MQINTKFHIGEMVYFLTKDSYDKYLIVKTKITKIKVVAVIDVVDENIMTRTTYIMQCENNFKFKTSNDNNLFRDGDEAQACCNTLNKNKKDKRR